MLELLLPWGKKSARPPTWSASMSRRVRSGSVRHSGIGARSLELGIFVASTKVTFLYPCETGDDP